MAEPITILIVDDEPDVIESVRVGFMLQWREIDIIGALEEPMAALSIALAGKPERPAGAPRPPREGTKQQAVLALLRRDEGATIAQIMEATVWQSHTVRGFLAGLKKKGTQVDVLDRVRQVGPNKEGAKGSYSIYRIVG